MEAQKPVLYNMFRSGPSWRVRLVLAIKGIDYEYRTVDMMKGEQETEEYKKLNPFKVSELHISLITFL